MTSIYSNCLAYFQISFIISEILNVDINECLDSIKTCLDGAVCFNTPGDYFCTCPTGYRSDGNERGHGCIRETRRQQFGVHGI